MMRACLRWAGSVKNLHLDVLSYGLIENQGFDTPLSLADVQGVSLAVENIRLGWVEGEKFYTMKQSQAWGKENGIESGLIRRSRSRARDSRIVQGVLNGESQAKVGGRFGITHQAVGKIVCRDAPLWIKPAAVKPWESEGISRRTWYYRRAR